MLRSGAEPDTGSMTNTWTNPQQWQPPMPYPDHSVVGARRSFNTLMIIVRVIGMVAAGPLVLVGAGVGARVLGSPGLLVGAAGTAVGIGFALGATHEERNRIPATVGYAAAAAAIAIALCVIAVIMVLSALQGAEF